MKIDEWRNMSPFQVTLRNVSELFTANIIKPTISTKNEIEIFNKLYAQKSRDSIAVEDTFAVSTYE